MFNEDEDIDVAAAVVLLMMTEEEELKKKRKQRSMWVRPYLREENTFYKTMLLQLQQNDAELFKNFVRMTADDFNFLLSKISPHIAKKNTNMREAICPGERLAITLRYLATGDSYASLMFLFKRSKATICNIVTEVCDAIFKYLKDEYLHTPSSEEEWEDVANGFNQKWNFPNCFGAIDGKHVEIIAPAKCGSEYFNYKKQNSVILMALVDAEYNFLFVDVGAKGRESDGGVFARCSLNAALENSLNLPPSKPLPGRSKPIPFVMVADDAFPLKSNIMKPFNFRGQSTSERIFSYRLSRARRVVENAFGIIAARFRILRKPIELSPEKVIKVVLAICTLHNFLNKRSSIYTTFTDLDTIDGSGSIVPGNWEMELGSQGRLCPLQPLRYEGRGSDWAKEIREEFKTYFMNEGDVPWQYKNLY